MAGGSPILALRAGRALRTGLAPRRPRAAPPRQRTMRSSLLLAVLALAAAACSGSEERPSFRRETPAEPAPEEAALEEPTRDAWIEADRQDEDFGDVYANAVRETTFDLVAAGSEDLVLKELKRSCGCTEGELYVLGAEGERTPYEVDRPYAPGTRFVLVAKLNTKGKQGQQDQKVHVWIDGHPLPTDFSLHANIVTFLELDPPQLEIEGASTLRGGQGRLAVQSRNGERFRVDVRREVLPQELVVELEPVDPDDEGRAARWDMSFRILPGVPKGPFKRKLILVTDALNEEAEALPGGEDAVHMGEIWIRTELEGVFDVRPERLNLGRLTPGKTSAQKVVLRSRDPDFQMRDLVVGLFETTRDRRLDHEDAFEVEAHPIDEGTAWEVELRVKDYPVAGNFSGLLGIRTDHPYEQEIAIPFIGTASK